MIVIGFFHNFEQNQHQNCYNVPIWCQPTTVQWGLSKHWSRNFRSFRSDLAVSCTKRFGELFLAISSCDKLCIWFKNGEKLTTQPTPRLFWCFLKRVWDKQTCRNVSPGASLLEVVQVRLELDYLPKSRLRPTMRWFGDPIFSRFGHPCPATKEESMESRHGNSCDQNLVENNGIWGIWMYMVYYMEVLVISTQYILGTTAPQSWIIFGLWLHRCRSAWGLGVSSFMSQRFSGSRPAMISGQVPSICKCCVGLCKIWNESWES